MIIRETETADEPGSYLELITLKTVLHFRVPNLLLLYEKVKLWVYQLLRVMNVRILQNERKYCAFISFSMDLVNTVGEHQFRWTNWWVISPV